MVELDTRTIFYFALLIDAISLLIVLLLWFQNRKTYRGLSFWTLDYAMQTASPLLLLLRGRIPDFVSIVIANTLIIGGTILLLTGLRIFLGKKNHHIHHYLLLMALIIILTYFSLVNDNLVIRTSSINAALMIVAFEGAWAVFYRMNRDTLRISWLAGIALLGVGFASLARIIGLNTSPAVSDFLNTGLFDRVMLITQQIFFIVLTFSLILMVNRRLIQDLLGRQQELSNRALKLEEAEKGLKEKEFRFSELFNNISTCVVVYEPMEQGRDFIIRDMNKAAEKTEKIEREEALNRAVTEVFPGIRDFGLLDVFRRVWTTGQPEHFAISLYSDNRISGWKDNYVYKLPGGEIVAAYEDVTARKIAEYQRDLAEQTLKQREELLEMIIEQTPNPLWLSDETGTVVRMNQALRDLLKVTDAEIIGKYNVLQDTQVIEQGYLERVKSVYSEGKTVSFTLYYYTGREKQVDLARNTFAVLDMVISPIKDREGKVVKVVCQHRDVTEFEKAKLALQKSEENFRNSLDSSPLGIRIISQAGELLYANQAILDIYGYSSFAELKDTPTSARYAPESYTAHVERKARRTRGEAVPSQYEISIVRRDGQRRDLQVLRKEVVWNGVKNYQSIYQDITERKQTESRMLEIATLKQINKAKSELLANVSHELRTPLASIKGFIETVLEPDVKWSNAQVIDFLQSAVAETDRLTFLIRDLLDMSRIESGKMVLDKRTYLVSEILDSASPVLSVITAKHKLETVIKDDLPPLQADKVRIAQVITNLVENATKFSPEGSPIIIEAKAGTEGVIFSIADRGEGISAEAAGHLFDRFYQAERVVSGKTRGTGLGLAICKGIVQAHGGRIWVESQPGAGSIFSFSLPLHAHEDMPA